MSRRRIDLFVEDSTHRIVLETMVGRLCEEFDVEPEFRWMNSTRGFGAVAKELARYVADLGATGSLPDVLVVASDGNCRGVAARRRELAVEGFGMPVVHAIPDPHVERWLLLDGKAFKQVLGTGCSAPDLKCDRDRYKQLLGEQVAAAGHTPIVGGIEHAEDLVRAMDLDRAGRADASLARFVADLRSALRTSGSSGP